MCHHAGVDASEVMDDHFWWRPGWRPDRAYLTWHVLPAPSVGAALLSSRAALADVGHLSVVPPRRLHVTGPGVGFVDEVPASRVEALVDAARRRMLRLPPFVAPLGAPVVGSNAVVMPAEASALTGLRLALRDTIRAAGLEPPGADDEPYRPHLTLAYATGPADRRQVHAALSRVQSERPVVEVTAVTLLALRMQPPGYEWTEVARVALG